MSRQTILVHIVLHPIASRPVSSVLPIAVTIALMLAIPSICVACGLRRGRIPKSNNFAPFVAAEWGAWVCWAFVHQRRHSRPWPRWSTLLSFFTTVATAHGVGLICDYLINAELTIYLIVVASMSSKAAAPFFFMAPDYSVRTLTRARSS